MSKVISIFAIDVLNDLNYLIDFVYRIVDGLATYSNEAIFRGVTQQLRFVGHMEKISKNKLRTTFEGNIGFLSNQMHTIFRINFNKSTLLKICLSK